MGNLRNVGIAEQRVYDDPQNPASSAYDVALPITVPDAVIDPGTGKNLSTMLNEHATEIAAAKAAAESASNAIGNLSEHNHDDRYYTESEVDSKLSGKADASHTHAVAEINGLSELIPAPVLFSVAVFAWTASSNFEFPFAAEIAASGVTAADSADIRFDKNSVKAAGAAGVITGETAAGKITLLAEKMPIAVLSGVYIISKGAV